MESKTIRGNYINASTALANNPASEARLNSGSYNNNSWCASRIDTSQYLEVCIFLVYKAQKAVLQIMYLQTACQNYEVQIIVAQTSSFIFLNNIQIKFSKVPANLS